MTSSLFGGCFFNNMSIFLGSLMPFGDVGGKIKRSFTFPFCFFCFSPLAESPWRSQITSSCRTIERELHLKQPHQKMIIVGEMVNWWFFMWPSGTFRLRTWSFNTSRFCGAIWVPSQVSGLRNFHSAQEREPTAVEVGLYRVHLISVWRVAHRRIHTFKCMLCCVCTFSSSFSCSRNLE